MVLDPIVMETVMQRSAQPAQSRLVTLLPPQGSPSGPHAAHFSEEPAQGRTQQEDESMRTFSYQN